MSNILRSVRHPPVDVPSHAEGPLTFIVAPSELRHSAVRLLLSHHGRPADERQVLDFLRMAVLRGINLSNLWVAMRGTRVVWAVLPIVSPGHTMLLLTSGVTPTDPEPERVIIELVDGVCRQHAKSGTDLVQMLVEPAQPTSSVLRDRCGFDFIAELMYLESRIRRSAKRPELPGGITLEHYSEHTHGKFAAAIGASYIDSLDCPAMNGVRRIDDVIAGHQATGAFDPHLWSVVLLHEKPVAVLLLSPVVHSEDMELVYLGVSPEARGQGLGALLMKLAAYESRSYGMARLTLAVDSRNTPAINLYLRSGMSGLYSKFALMRNVRQEQHQQLS